MSIALLSLLCCHRIPTFIQVSTHLSYDLWIKPNCLSLFIRFSFSMPKFSQRWVWDSFLHNGTREQIFWKLCLFFFFLLLHRCVHRRKQSHFFQWTVSCIYMGCLNPSRYLSVKRKAIWWQRNILIEQNEENSKPLISMLCY